MNEIERIQDQLHRSCDGEAWHGPALGELLKDVSAEEALFSPSPDVHSIREIVRHIRTWASVTRRRVEGEKVGPVADSEDWPESSREGEESWDLERLDLAEAYARLVRSLGELDEKDLDEEVLDGGSRYRLLHGVVQHGLYHAGQVVLLKKLFRSDHREPEESSEVGS